MQKLKNRASGLQLAGAISVVAASVLLGTAPQVFGVTSVTYNFDQTLFGTPPTGPVPWLTAVFSDVSPGNVQVTLSAPGLTGAERVNQWYFNLNPALDPSALSITQSGSAGAFGAPAVSTGTDSFKANYDGKYDLMFSFSSAVGSQFVHGDSITFSISGIAGLTANDFVYQNTPSSGHGTMFAAANIETVGQAVVIDSPPEVNGVVPDGGVTVILLGLALISLEGARRFLRFARS